MKKNDFLICTFDGDTNTPPIQYAPEITEVNTSESFFNCTLEETGQRFKFNYTDDLNAPWEGTDEAGVAYTLATHQVFSGGSIDPEVNGAAIVTFGDGKRYLAYVNSIDPSIDLVFYFPATPSLSVQGNKIIKSTWDKYPENTDITSIEGCVAGDVVGAGATGGTSSTPEDTSETRDDKSEQAGGDAETDDSGDSGTATGSVTGSSKFLLVDVYSGDLQGKPAWNVLVQAPDFYGGIIKATQGTKGWSNDRGWFKTNWPLVKSIGGARYGSTWFRGAYLFLNMWQDGTLQAEHYLNTITDAGGWDSGDILPIIDVELGNDGSNGRPRNKNNDASAQEIIDCTSACAEKIKTETGRKVMLYGRGAMRDKGIKDKMGCDCVWNPSYTATMVKNGLDAWTLDDIVLWQYCGDGTAALDQTKFPRSIPGFGKVDISVYIDGANKTTMDSLITRLGINTVH